MRTLLGLLIFFHLSSWAQIKTLVIIGDSLTEGYGVSQQQSFPSLLEEKMNSSKKSWKVINAGISGSTSASAVSRIKWHLKQKPNLIILALGSNDGLRGLSTNQIISNLDKAIEVAKASQTTIVLAGLKMPPNYGAKYTQDFALVFPQLSKKHKIPLIPFLLKDVAGEKSRNLSDGIHPNESGHKIIAETVFQSIKELL